MRVLIACEESQEVCKAFRRKGHEAYSCDLIPCSGGYPEWHLQGDVLDYLDHEWDLMIAHPPCTRLTNAGSRWLKEPPKGKTLVQMWRDLFEGAEFYNKLREAPIEKIAIENPVFHKHARELLGNPSRYVVQPWWFGDKAFKATGFEIKNLPALVEGVDTLRATVPKSGTEEHKKWSECHRMSPGPERARLRSKTYPGIADAMAEQWGSL